MSSIRIKCFVDECKNRTLEKYCSTHKYKEDIKKCSVEKCEGLTRKRFCRSHIYIKCQFKNCTRNSKAGLCGFHTPESKEKHKVYGIEYRKREKSLKTIISAIDCQV